MTEVAVKWQIKLITRIRSNVGSTHLLGSTERQPSVEAVFIMDDVEDLEVLGVELTLRVVLVYHTVVAALLQPLLRSLARLL